MLPSPTLTCKPVNALFVLPRPQWAPQKITAEMLFNETCSTPGMAGGPPHDSLFDDLFRPEYTPTGQVSFTLLVFK